MRATPIFLATSTILALFSAVGAVAARDIGPAAVKAGQPVVVVNYATYNPETCNFAALPTLRITQQPAHGTLTIDKIRRKQTTGVCEGQTFTAAVAIYKSAAGYHGRDEMTVDVAFESYLNAPRGGGDTVHVILDVK